MAVSKDIVAKSGSWFSYKEERIGQGRENAKEYIEARPEMMKKIEAEVMTAYGITRNISKEQAAKESASNAAAANAAASAAKTASAVAKAPAVAAATKK